MRSTQLFGLLKTLPKGALHHDHFDCNEDPDFYREHIITDPTIFLSKDKNSFCIGTKEEAKQKEWISWEELRKQYES